MKASPRHIATLLTAVLVTVNCSSKDDDSGTVSINAAPSTTLEGNSKEATTAVIEASREDGLRQTVAPTPNKLLLRVATGYSYLFERVFAFEPGKAMIDNRTTFQAYLDENSGAIPVDPNVDQIGAQFLGAFVKLTSQACRIALSNANGSHHDTFGGVAAADPEADDFDVDSIAEKVSHGLQAKLCGFHEPRDYFAAEIAGILSDSLAQKEALGGPKATYALGLTYACTLVASSFDCLMTH